MGWHLHSSASTLPCLAHRMQRTAAEVLPWLDSGGSPATPQQSLGQLLQPKGAGRRSISPALPRAFAGRSAPQPSRVRDDACRPAFGCAG